VQAALFSTDLSLLSRCRALLQPAWQTSKPLVSSSLLCVIPLS